MSAREIIEGVILSTPMAQYADPDAVLSALSEAGYTVARLEHASYVKVRRVVRDFETTPPRPDMTREAMELLYRVASPVAPPVSREAQ